MTLAERVKELRNKLGWSQAVLAQKSGVTQATISRIENGRVANPLMRELQKLAETLGTSIDYLAGRDEKEKSEIKALVAVWEQSCKILRDIRDLAEINTFFAYGVIRQGEVIVDFISVANMQEAEKIVRKKAKVEE